MGSKGPSPHALVSAFTLVVCNFIENLCSFCKIEKTWFAADE